MLRQLGRAPQVSALFTSFLMSSARSQCEYEVSTFWIPGAQSVYVSDREPDGRLVGSYSIPAGQRAYRQNADGTLVVLHPRGAVYSLANSIAGNGIIAGAVRFEPQMDKPCLWIDDVWTTLPFPAQATECRAEAVNSNGVAVGMWRQPDSTPWPAMWVDGAFIDLGPVLGVTYGLCDAITEDGNVYGTAGFPGYAGFHAFRWNSVSGDLTIYDSIYGRVSVTFIHRVASNGLVTGQTYTDLLVDSQGYIHDGSAMIGLGAPRFCDRTSGSGVNALGAVVGSAQECGATNSTIAFLWMNGQFAFVRDLLVSPFAATVQGASIVSDDGVIVASGKDANGVTAVLLLKPIRTRPGDVTIDCKVDEHDLTALFEFWGKTYAYDNGPGDLNGDHLVDAHDLAFVLGDWGP